MQETMDDFSSALIQQALAGDRRSLERIVVALERPFFNLALRMLLVPADAEDAAQESLIRVVTRLSRFDGRSKFSTWAWKVAVNRILETRRALQPMFPAEAVRADLSDGLDLSVSERIEDHVVLGEVKISCGRAMLQCLDGEHRLAFILGEILEIDGAEASEILGIEAAAFRKRLSRARERIRVALASCGVVHGDGMCQCHRRLRRATELGRIVPGQVTTREPLDVAQLRCQIASIHEALREAAYYRSDPEAVPSRDLVRAALEPFHDGGRAS